MHPLDRRGFLGASLAALAAAPAAAAAPKREPLPVAPAPREVPVPGLDSLFLTWRQDPTTTAVVQWVGFPGAAELIDAYGIGIVMPNEDDTTSFARTVAALADDAAQRERMRANCAAALDDFSAATMVRRTLDLYRALVAQGTTA